MKLVLMGTGTSHGVPMIGCTCKVCTSSDMRDCRYRCSAYLMQGETRILLDVGPEFRLQALRAHIDRLDAVLISHSHADHLHGLDDLRVFSHTKPCKQDREEFPETAGEGLPVYCNAETIRDIHYRFDYLFKDVQEGGGKPKLDFIDCSSADGSRPIVVGAVRIVPIPLLHGHIPTSGWLLMADGADGRAHGIAYLTDCSAIAEDSLARITCADCVLDHVVIDALRIKPHSTHFCYDDALACAEKLAARHTWFIHMNHDLLHTEIQSYIADHLCHYPVLDGIVRSGGTVAPAYDQQELCAGA